jgi:uncharacterized membrane protein YfcA
LNPTYLRSGGGMLLIVYGIYGLVQPKFKPAPDSISVDTGVGFVNGIVAGLTSLPGFIILIRREFEYVQPATWPGGNPLAR